MNVLRIISGLFFGVLLGLILLYLIPSYSTTKQLLISPLVSGRREIIGFLPFALLGRASTDYDSYITTLSYFGLTLETDGSIRKMNNAQEEEPGWNALRSGKVDSFLNEAKTKNITKSLVVYSGNNDDIEALMANPIEHAKNLTKDILPLMQKYGFNDLNIDIESTKQASPEAQKHFVQFVQTVKKDLNDNQINSVTIDISTVDVINNKDLIVPKDIANIADKIVLMAYDYHSPSSYVTGAVAPLDGAGVDAEYDVTSALQKTLAQVPKEKLILGFPTYGYEWESVGSTPRSAVIPGSGGVLSSKRAENVLAKCATCSAQFDNITQESYAIFLDPSTGAYHQLFYPNKQSTQSKIDLANINNLLGVGIWALGYEDDSIMQPLADYKK